MLEDPILPKKHLPQLVPGHPLWPKVIKTQDGDFRIHLCSSEFVPYISSCIQREYTLLPGFLANPNYIILDIGANVGFYTVIQAKRLKGGKCFSFEPNPNVVSLLQENVKLNKLEEVVEVLPFAVGSLSGDVMFDDFGALSTRASIATGRGLRPRRVPMITLDWFVAKYGIPRIDLVKIDVEGSEVEVLKGATKVALPMTKRIVLEYHGSSRLAEVRYICAESGFTEIHHILANSIVYFQRGDIDVQEALP